MIKTDKNELSSVIYTLWLLERTRQAAAAAGSATLIFALNFVWTIAHVGNLAASARFSEPE